MTAAIRAVYFLGIAVGLAAGYVRSDLIIVFGVGHVLLLSGMGLLVTGTDRQAVGIRVQTAGYLHTLIGFAAALYRIDPQDPSVAQVLAPLGSALVTSIVGWSFGTELAESAEGSSMKLQSEADRLAAELGGFATAIRSIQEDYVSTISKASDEFKKMHRNQEDAIRKATDGTERLQGAIAEVRSGLEDLNGALTAASSSAEASLGDAFVESMNSVRDRANELASDLATAAIGARDMSTYLAESRALLEQLEKLAEMIAARPGAPDA